MAVGAYALGSAYRSAWINVLINLGSLKDAELVASVREEGERLLARADELETTVAGSIASDLGG